MSERPAFQPGGVVPRAALVLVDQPTLSDLATEANTEHEKVLAHAQRAVAHAVRCGEALLAARQIVRGSGGKWELWVAENLTVRESTVRAYMRLAAYKEVVFGRAEAPDNVRAALGYLRGLPSIDGAVYRHPPELRVEARDLVQAGASKREAAQILGVDPKTIRDWTADLPGAGKTGRRTVEGKALYQQRAQKLARARKARAALRREERDRAMRKLGGSAADAYAKLRRTAQALDRALADAADRSVRNGLETALAKVHQAEDEIVRALGVERARPQDPPRSDV